MRLGVESYKEMKKQSMTRRDIDYLIFERALEEQKKRIEELTIERDLYKQLKDELVEQLIAKDAEIQRLKEIALEVGL